MHICAGCTEDCPYVTTDLCEPTDHHFDIETFLASIRAELTHLSQQSRLHLLLSDYSTAYLDGLKSLR